MPNTSQIIASKPLKAALSKYPNLYYRLTEGALDGTVSKIVDQAGTGLDLTVASPAAAQWDSTTATWKPPAPNSTYYLSAAASLNPSKFAELFDNLGSSAWFVAFDAHYSADVAAGQRVFTVSHPEAGNNYRVVEVRANVATGSSKFAVYDSNLTIASRTNTVASTDGRRLCFFYFDKRSNGTQKSVYYEFLPGSAAHLESTPSDYDISASSFVGVDTAVDKLYIGAQEINTGVERYLDGAGIRDFRFVNFGQNPPSDVLEFIEELAVNHMRGTRREW